MKKKKKKNGREKSWSVHIIREILIRPFFLSNHLWYLKHDVAVAALQLLGWWLLLSSSLHLLLVLFFCNSYRFLFMFLMRACWPTKWPAIGHWYAYLSMPTYSTYSIRNNMNNDVVWRLTFSIFAFFPFSSTFIFLQLYHWIEK